MSRIPRRHLKSITKTYHILLRGINKQDIFLDNVDKSKFFRELKRAKEEFGFKIDAYVIMNNHVHLVIYDENDNLSKIIHKIATKYGLYFNKKYDRVGHVFQNRYKSICVETEAYLKNLVRYVLRNPQKDRDKYIYEISNIKGISVKQMSRLLGIGSPNIYKIINKIKKD